MSGVGRQLQEARRRRGLTLDEVERETRVRKRFLLALEQEEYDSLPPPVYALGFLKVYARFLDLDPAPMVKHFAEATGTAAAPLPLHKQAVVQAPLPSSARRSDAASSAMLAIIVIAAVVLAGSRLKDPFMGLVSGIGGSQPQASPTAVAIKPAPAPAQAESRSRPTLPVTEAAGGGDLVTSTTDSAPRLVITPPWFQAPAERDPRAAPGTGVRMPALVGRRSEEARTSLEQLGLRVATEEWASGSAPAGEVLWQRPDIGATIPRGELVQLAVSSGPKLANIPDVVGKTQDDAAKVLLQSGIVNPPVVRVQGPKDLSPAVLNSVCNGCVLSVSPPPGSGVTPDAIVAIAVRQD